MDCEIFKIAHIQACSIIKSLKDYVGNFNIST